MTAADRAGECSKPGLSRLERVRAYRAEFGGEIARAIVAVDAEIYRQEYDGRLRLAAAAPDLLEAAREGLIRAEADLENELRLCAEWNDDADTDATVAVLRERRDKIAVAIAKASAANSVGTDERSEGVNP